VLMASAVVVLKHETSTISQRHNFISIDLTFGVNDYVREVTSPDKIGSGPMSGRDATRANIYGYCDFFLVFVLFLFLYSSAELQSIPVIQFSISKDAIWWKEDPFWDEKCVILKFGGILP